MVSSPVSRPTRDSSARQLLAGSPGSAGGAGNGQGGAISVLAGHAGSQFRVTGDAEFLLDGIGAEGVGCIVCTIDGGSGTGGSLQIGNLSATTGNVIRFSNLTAEAVGTAGNSSTMDGAAGSGGLVQISGSGVAVRAGDITIAADGVGGSAFVGSSGGGAGRGGSTVIDMGAGASLNATTLTASAGGFGGDGAKADGATTSHTYTAPGTYTLTLTVRSPLGMRQVHKTLSITKSAPYYPNPHDGNPPGGYPAPNPNVRLPTPEPG